MKRFQNILVAVDTRLDSNNLMELATELAIENCAELKIVDVVPKFGWLAHKSTDDLEHLRHLLKDEKKEKLQVMAEKLNEKATKVSTRVLSGETSVAITREVQRDEHDLVIAVAKGKNSKRKGSFGQTATRLLRQCPSAVWLVAADSPSKFRHVLGCVDTASTRSSDMDLNDKVFEIGESLSQYHNSDFSVLHAWHFEDEPLLSTRFDPETMKVYLRDEEQYRREHFDKFLRQHGSNADSRQALLIKGETASVIENQIEKLSVDLLVMGTTGRRGLSGIFIGNTAEKILERVTCSVLTVKPYEFKSPIKPG